MQSNGKLRYAMPPFILGQAEACCPSSLCGSALKVATLPDGLHFELGKEEAVDVSQLFNSLA